MTRFWSDRRTLVTGASGLVGGWLVEALLGRQAEVVAYVRDWVPHSRLFAERIADRVTVARGDVRDRDALERVLVEYEIDTVFHLAAQTLVGIANLSALSTFESNVAGTWSLLEACRRAPTVRQIVVASSDKAYGDHGSLPYTEELMLRGRHPYDASKACADVITQSYAATFNMPVAITRCGNFFGGGDLNWSRIVPSTIRSIWRGEPPVIRSDGSLVRDYFYVEDGVEAYLLLAESLANNPELRGEAFNFGYEESLSVLDMVRCIAITMGAEAVPEIRDVASHEIRHQTLSCQKARTWLGWTPSFTLNSGLDRTVDWYRRYLNAST